MFGIGMQEIALICAIALVVVGPKKLPDLARALGKGYGEFRHAFDEMRHNVETDLQTEEIRRSLLDLPPPPSSKPAAPAPPPDSLLIAQPSPLEPRAPATAAAPAPAPAPTEDQARG